MSSNEKKRSDVEKHIYKHAIFIRFIPNVDCIIPSYLNEMDSIVFEMGANMPNPIPDLRVTSEGISGTLSFVSREFHCFVPWENIISIFRNNPKIYEAYPSPNFAKEMKEFVILPPPPEKAMVKSRPSYLRPVNGEKKKTFLDGIARGPLADRSHLRLVQD